VRGIFITFEGPDGAGKSTQIRNLAEYIDKKGLPYVLTREPGGTKISDAVRSILLDPDHGELENETEVLLYAASRAQHVREVIRPALAEGKIVLCDRFVDASIAYQGHGLGVSIEDVVRVNRFATGGLVPDRTYLIDIPPEVARERLLQRTDGTGKPLLDRIERKGLDYHRRVRAGFQAIYRENKQRILWIDGNQPEAVIFRDIVADFQKRFESVER